MKYNKTTRTGFTLIEVIVVMAVMILLISLLFPAVTRALARAKQTKCESQLGSIAKIWTIRYNEIDGSFRSRTDDRIYPWLSSMFPDDIGDPNLFVCPADTSNGEDGSKPDSTQYADITGDNDQFPETDDNASNDANGDHARRNPDIERNSYMYEFSDASNSWWNNYVKAPDGGFATIPQIDNNGDGRITWAEVKVDQLAYGDTHSQGPYDPNEFPIIRCFHHYQDRQITVRNVDTKDREPAIRVLNAAMTGRVFMSGPRWEYPLDQ